MMRQETCERFINIIQKPYGIVMVVGPTGSGKTTTLHSALGFINKPERKIWTAEDPVEITQAGLRQLQVNPKWAPPFPRRCVPFSGLTLMSSWWVRCGITKRSRGYRGLSYRPSGLQHTAHQFRP